MTIDEVDKPVILHVTEAVGGGVPKVIESYARNTPMLSHHVLTADATDAYDADLFDAVTHLPRGPLRRTRAIRRYQIENPPAIVHAHSSWAGVFTRVWPTNAPVIYEPHAFKFEDPRSWSLTRSAYRVAERLLAHRSAAIIAVTDHEAGLARQITRQPVHVVPNIATVDLPSHGPVDRAGQTHRLRDVVMIGRICPQKDPHFFAECAQLARDRDLPMRFTWIGDGEPGLRRHLARNGVSVSGWLSTASIRDVVADALAYLHTATYEGFPLSLLDAAAMGTPILARPLPSLRDVDVETIADVEAALDSLHRIVLDPRYGSTLIEKSRLISAAHTPEAQTSALLAAYSPYLGVLERNAPCR